MSQQWRRVPADTLCGYCVNRVIAKGEPVLFTTLPTVKRERVRCVSCAGPAPPDLPERLEVAGVAEMAHHGFSKLSNHAPRRTRGALREAVKEWMPYRDPGEEG